MNIPREQIKFGHTEGHSDLCYSSDGKYILSCGADGDIRVWNGFQDNDPVIACSGADSALSLKQIAGHIYCATDYGTVQILTYPDVKRDSVLAKFSASVNHIVGSKDHKFVAVCGEDATINLINLETKDSLYFHGAVGPALSVAICPKVEMLAAGCGDGKLRIFNISDQTVIKDFNCAYDTTSFSTAKTLARMHFEPTKGLELAYPMSNAVLVTNVRSWETVCTLRCETLDNALFSIVEYSPCGHYIAASTSNGDIVIWNVDSSTVVAISSASQEAGCSALTWNPKKSDELIYTEMNGRFGLLKIPLKGGAKSKKATIIDDIDMDGDSNDIFNDNGSENELAFTKIPSDDDDDENTVSIEKLKRQYLDTDDKDKDSISKKSRSPSPRSRTPQIPLQEAFMPTSSPEHLDRRYMCWNEIAVIRSYNAGVFEELDSNKSIEVEFHDSTFHSNITMSNFMGYTMGSISSTVLVTAHRTQFSVVPLSAGSKEWTVTMRELETIVCLATSDNMICLGTDANIIHVYTIFGIQKSAMAAPGPIVTMSSHGHYLLVAYHQAGVRVNDQVIGIMLVKFEGMNIDCRYLNAPLSPGSTLRWLGFSDKGSPGTFDSEGILFLYPVQSNVWIPFFDSRIQFASPADTLFVASVHETTATIRGIKCRSGVYPVFVPRPSLLELPLQPPFVEISTEKGLLESNLFTWSSLKVDDIDKKYKETALKTFALSCKSNLDMRAFDLVETLKDPQILNLAIKYATKMNRKRLAEKLTLIESDIGLDCDFTQISVNNTPTEKSNSTRVLKPKENTKVLLSQKRRNMPAFENNTPLKDQESISQDLFCTPIPTASTDVPEQIPDTPEVQHKNPFLKCLQKENSTYNPLSLIDKYAGIGGISDNKTAEKRKQPDVASPPEKQEKQRKLDKFIFSKRK